MTESQRNELEAIFSEYHEKTEALAEMNGNESG